MTPIITNRPTKLSWFVIPTIIFYLLYFTIGGHLWGTLSVLFMLVTLWVLIFRIVTELVRWRKKESSTNEKLLSVLKLIVLAILLIAMIISMAAIPNKTDPNKEPVKLNNVPIKWATAPKETITTTSPPIITEEDELRNTIKNEYIHYLASYDNDHSIIDDFMSRLVTVEIIGDDNKEIKISLNDATQNTPPLLNWTSMGRADAETAIIYKAIFTYGGQVKKASIEIFDPAFQDAYGNDCRVLESATKVDNPNTIKKVNWANISPIFAKDWWVETYNFIWTIDKIYCK